MSRRILILPIVFALVAAGAAEAQYGGGMGGGMGGGGRHGGGRHKQDRDAPPASSAPGDQAPAKSQGPLAKVQITGVVTRIDAATGRVTISYDEVDALNWPAGTTPFQVEKPSLMDGLTVGEKVRFHLESQQISSIEPIGPSGSPGTR